MTFRYDTLVLEEAQHARHNGQGRRPSQSMIVRLEKRQGLSWASYDAALKRLEELASARRQTNPLAALHRAVAEANRR